MKYWQKMLDLWKPLQDESDIPLDDLMEELGEDSVVIDAFTAGFDAAIDIALIDIVDALEGELAHRKMKKNYRHGFLDAAEIVYQIFDRYSEGDLQVTKSPRKPYWRAQMSYDHYEDHSVVTEWDSFGRRK